MIKDAAFKAVLWEWPTLYGKSKAGKIKAWKIWVGNEKKIGSASIFTEHGFADGKKQLAEVIITKGKNVGRSNETTPLKQARLEAESKWKKKQDKGYVLDPSGESNLLLPMLALKFTERKHDIVWPALAQPKLNGIRCLAHRITETKMKYTSREGKVFTTLAHLTPVLLKTLKVGEIFDGELFTRELTFQRITSVVKKLQPNTAKLQLWVYDIVEEDTPFSLRHVVYRSMIAKAKSKLLVAVQTQEVKDETELMQLHGHYTHDGYEGTMVRNMGGKYLKMYKSKDLQKYKDFLDDEYLIVGAKEGVGKFKGLVTWICVTKDGEEFDCVPNGTHADLRAWWKSRKKHIGKSMLTVKYQNLSDDRKVPVFPKGLAIRDYE